MTPNSQKLSFQQKLLFIICVLCIFLLMVCGMAFELLIASFASHQRGDSIYHFSVAVGLFLSAMGVGSYFSQKVETSLAFWMVQTFLFLSLVGSVAILLLTLAHLHTLSFAHATYFFLFVIGSLVGIQLPWVIRFLEHSIPLKDLLAKVMFFDYLGGLVGSLLFSWILLPRLGFLKGSVLLSMICFGAAFLLFVMTQKQFSSQQRKVTLFLSCFVCLSLGSAWFWGELFLEKNIRAVQKGITTEYLFHSPYQEIRFSKFDKSYFLTLNQQIQFSTQDEHIYHETLVHIPLSLSPEKKRVLLLGGGDGLALREIWKYHQVKEVVMVDLDPAMTQFGKNNALMKKFNKNSMKSKVQKRTYCLYYQKCTQNQTLLFQQIVQPKDSCLWKPSSSIPKTCNLLTQKVNRSQRLQIINQDAWKFLETNRKDFSVIISDLPDATNISLSKLYSVEFYKQLKKHLSSKGLLAIQSTTVSPGFRKGFWCIVHSVQASGMSAKGFQVWVPSFTKHTSYTLASKHKFVETEFHLAVPTKFLNEEIVPKLFWFPKDIQEVPTELNTIDTHHLLRYMLKND